MVVQLQFVSKQLRVIRLPFPLADNVNLQAHISVFLIFSFVGTAFRGELAESRNQREFVNFIFRHFLRYIPTLRKLNTIFVST